MAGAPTDREYAACAKYLFESDRAVLQVDDDAGVVPTGTGTSIEGAWVSAWVWVDRAQAKQLLRDGVVKPTDLTE